MFKNGHPLYYHNKPRIKINTDGPLILPDAIQAKIYPEISNTHCWIIGGSGGSVFRYARKAWIGAFGEIPKGLYLCHKCDNINGPCGNPSHMFLGTQKDNMSDCSTKKRTGESKMMETKKIMGVPLFGGNQHTSEIAKTGWLTRKIRGHIGAFEGWEKRRALGKARSRETIIQIYSAQGSQREIAKRFGVSQQQVSRIKSGKNCKKITVAII